MDMNKPTKTTEKKFHAAAKLLITSFYISFILSAVLTLAITYLAAKWGWFLERRGVFEIFPRALLMYSFLALGISLTTPGLLIFIFPDLGHSWLRGALARPYSYKSWSNVSNGEAFLNILISIVAFWAGTWILYSLIMNGLFGQAVQMARPSITPANFEVTKSPTKELSPARIPLENLPAQEFSGYYTASFEVSSFVPCSDNDLPGYGRGYWLDMFSPASFHKRYSELVTEIGRKNPQSQEDVIVFVRFIGFSSNPFSFEGRHGHMNLYKQEVLVKELIEMKPFEEGQCN